MKKWHVLLLSCLVILVDQLSKYWVAHPLTPYKPLSIMPMVNITPAYNTGAAFSFLSGTGNWHKWFFTGFSLIVSIILFIWLLRTPLQQKLQSVGISLILGGAVGNLIDRSIQGYVIDFIDVYYEYHHFATFNLADAAICVGAAFLVLDLILNRDADVKE